MFQSFVSESSPEQGPPRLSALRGEMGKEGLDAFVVPRADVHQGEYVAPRDARLAWLTGFTGSAGFCVAALDKAAVFVDGRYRLQVRAQVAKDFTPVDWPETQLAHWLKDNLPRGARVGFDPWLHTAREIKNLEEAVSEAELTLVSVQNLIDRIWTDQPGPPDTEFAAHPLEFAGESSQAKRLRLSADRKGTTVLTLPDSIAWLLNIRGTDIERNPVPQAFALLHEDATVTLYCLPGKADSIGPHLGSEVTVVDINMFESDLAKLTGTVHIDPKSCPHAIASLLGETAAIVSCGDDPCVLPKAIKNDTEIAGSRAAHLRDGAAMVRFLAWLEKVGPGGGLTEIDVVKKLETFRRETNQLRDISFETICGAGEHGAIVHYRVTEDSDAPVRMGELLLVDSGGQYSDGTTDITRTIAIGTAGEEERACYTRVLQGMIAISRARFPKGVGGQHLDALARYPLWLAGQDYDHGTGHGVGAYLSVHEGPQSISRRSDVALQPGMILSNEPGYYREGAFGIRIENLIVVTPAPMLEGGDDREMRAFETLTWVPFDRHLINQGLLCADEKLWIDRYHADTLLKIGPLVDGEALEWLRQACAPL